MTWQLQEAKARFSELIEATLREGPQVVTRRGIEAAVVVPIKDWKRLSAGARPAPKEVLLAPEPRSEEFAEMIPKRGRLRGRKSIFEWMYLLGTNVIAETRNPPPRGCACVDQPRSHGPDVSVRVELGELQAGAERTRRQGPALAVRYDAWIDLLASTWKIISMDVDESIFREWARLMVGQSGGLSEGAMIAATARGRGLTVVTRDAGDSQHFPVPVLNPFSTRR
ncbi:MAG: type II toxin-antitoxin system prevent-host-death family antitoxin [Acidobacteriota bacterium]